MKNRSRQIIMIALLLAMLLCHPAVQFGCGPFSERAVFKFNVHPDFPLDKFAAGELGVLEPGYARSYLTVAYRYFAGVGLDAQEQKAAVALWKHRLNEGDETEGETSIKSWIDARAKVPGLAASTEINPNRNISTSNYYFDYLNCNPHAFQTAVKTLDRLTKQFGQSSPQLKDWVQGQDQVFANCSGSPIIPAELGGDAPAPAKSERTYQIAAANFYAGKFDDAQRIFEQIGNDKASAWRASAPYMAARSLIRKATLTGVDNQIDKTTLAMVEPRLKKIIDDPNQKSMQAAAKRLMSYVRFRLNPEERLHELAQSVIQKNSGQTLNQDLYDYTALIDKYITDNDSAPTFEHLPTVGRNDDVTDWVLMFQVMDTPAADYSIKKYEQTSSLPWLVAAISKTESANPKAAALIEAAAKVKAASPAYATVEYHRLRLMIGSGRKDDARKELDQVLASMKPSMPVSVRNDFLSLRMSVAANLDEFLKFAQRNASAFTFDEDGRELPEDISGTEDNSKQKTALLAKTMFDDDSTKIFNGQLPLSVLKDAAVNKTLPDHLRRNLVIATWVRATLLDKDDIAKAMVPELEQLVPEFKEQITGYVLDPTSQARKFTATYMILKYPGTRPIVDVGLARQTEFEKIDDYRDNWWCAFDKKAEATTDDTEKKNGLKLTIEAPDFLTSAQKVAAAAEQKKLMTFDTAPNYLCAEAIRWATAQPNDARVPEALSLAVRSTRYGCTNAGTGKLSKQVYDLLHKKYPTSEWAAKTKYWFKD